MKQTEVISNPTLMPVYYHGTIFDFSTFDADFLGYSCNNPTTEFGFFFSDNFDDALYWARRSALYNTHLENPALRMVQAHLHVTNTLHISYEKFYYYLQTARKSTIKRHLAQWIDKGYDSLSLVRNGHKWTAVFDKKHISVVSNHLV
jgi:hypothetical protein